jgi:6,7-dimethyl-8-ribityllumazine synthase
MARTIVDLSHLPDIVSPGRIAILRSKWYPEIVDSMSSVCAQALRDAGYQRVEIHTLPGSLELPLAAADLLAADSAGDDEYNKGYEAAAAAIEMIHWRRSLPPIP